MGVTVVGPSTTLNSQQASQTCSSLSQQACYGVNPSICSSYGGGQGAQASSGTGNGLVVASSAAAAAQITHLPGVWCAAAGAIGVAGALI